MSITPASLMKWVESLDLDCEEACRASVSRAYYAAYHDCLAFHGGLPTQGVSRTACGIHENLIHQLQHPSPETKKNPELINRSKTRAYLLRVIRPFRVQADYEMRQDIDHCYTSNAIAKASQVMSI
jgi:hypothetical protein